MRQRCVCAPQLTFYSIYSPFPAATRKQTQKKFLVNHLTFRPSPNNTSQHPVKTNLVTLSPGIFDRLSANVLEVGNLLVGP